MGAAWKVYLPLGAIATTLIAGELYCRIRDWPIPAATAAGFAPMRGMHEVDARLGWRPKPGKYSWGAIPVTILDDGSRDTGAIRKPTPDVVALGCSYTFGSGVADAETYPARLRQASGLDVRNFGVAAYGAYQSLLRLEALRPTWPTPPKVVLYGLIEDQEARSNGDPTWAFLLVRFGHLQAGPPFAGISPGGTLEHHERLEVKPWPLSEALRIVGLFQLVQLREKYRAHLDHGRQVTQLALAEMGAVARRGGSRFAVVLLELAPAAKDEYRRFLAERGVDAIDCTEPYPGAYGRLRDGRHPDARTDAAYAACIHRWLGQHPL
jgi:hypothetical protein